MHTFTQLIRSPGASMPREIEQCPRLQEQWDSFSRFLFFFSFSSSPLPWPFLILSFFPLFLSLSIPLVFFSSFPSPVFFSFVLSIVRSNLFSPLSEPLPSHGSVPFLLTLRASMLTTALNFSNFRAMRFRAGGTERNSGSNIRRNVAYRDLLKYH